MEFLNSIGLSIVSFIFVLGVMIFIHELGHYLVAMLLGIRVEVFSLGFGRRLIGFRRGNTDYRISLLPLGGYVKMAGENYDEEITGSPEEFLSRPKTHRFAVAVAGPLMNLVLALVLVTVTFSVGVPVYKYLRQPALIGSVQTDSPAEQAGLKVQDTILAIDGDPTPTWQEAEILISMSPNQDLDLTIERQGESLHRRVRTSVAKGLEIGTIGVSPYVAFVVAAVLPGTPAERAELGAGDEILQVTSGDQTAVGFHQSREMISASQGNPLLFKIRRGDDVFKKTIAPAELEGSWRIGAAPVLDIEVEKHGLLNAIRASIERNYRITALTFDVLGRIVTGRTSLRTLSGPVEIARYSGKAASAGPLPLLGFMAFVSLQLGILNLMPIPILDGGLIALLAFEALIRRDLSVRVKERIFQVGFIFLVALMGIVIFNDIVKTLPVLD